MEPYFLKTNNLEFTPALGWLNKPYAPMLTLNLNVSDISLLCGVEKTTVASCIQSLIQRIGEILRGHENVEIDLEDLGKLYCELSHVYFKPMVKSMNMNQHLGKMNVKRLMEIKTKNTNMNF